MVDTHTPTYSNVGQQPATLIGSAASKWVEIWVSSGEDRHKGADGESNHAAY